MEQYISRKFLCIIMYYIFWATPIVVFPELFDILPYMWVYVIVSAIALNIRLFYYDFTMDWPPVMPNTYLIYHSIFWAVEFCVLSAIFLTTSIYLIYLGVKNKDITPLYQLKKELEIFI